MSQLDPDRPQPPANAGCVGCALGAIAVLFLVPSGLCTAIGTFGILSEFMQNPNTALSDLADMTPLILVTLASLAIGALLLWAAIRSRPR